MRSWRTALTTLIVLLAVGVAASVSGSHPTRAQAAQQITIQNFAFGPASVTIPVGSTVTWTNQESGVDHTTTSDASSTVAWDSRNLAPGASYSVTFIQTGTFTYHCSIHPFMTGTIIVQGAGNPTTTNTIGPNATATPTATPSPTPTATVPPRPPTATPVPNSPPKRKAISVKQSGFTYRFAPATVTVKVGTRVTWSNLTGAPHTVTARGTWKFASKMFTRNHTVSFTFKKVGTYKYFCSIHPYMKGTIVVRR
jgi:plastocyanin